MLIRISGGAGGIKEYLEDGQKKDRFYSRDELDERVILDGDLLLTDTIIQSMLPDKNKYFHITMAFKEDYLEPETIAKINQEFKEYFLSGYHEDEINYYAEAHLPKIKSYISSSSDNELVERKPHIHIVIPRLSLADGISFNPFIPHITKYIDSFQEYINAKYGLESPKDNLRTNFNSASEAISRYKGDIFAANGREQKLAILKLIIKNNTSNMEELKSLLIKNGYEIKVRNKTNAGTCYLNIKKDEDVKGLNLKESVFRDEFLCLPLEAKLSKLNSSKSYTYMDSSLPRNITDKHKQNMQEWVQVKALEIRFINRAVGRSERKSYNKLSREDKIAYLSNKQQKHYNEHIAVPETNNDDLNNESSHDLFTEKSTTIKQNIPAGNDNMVILSDPKESPIDQLIEENNQYNKQQTYKSHLSELNTNVHADILLELTEKIYGTQPELYSVTKSHQGVDRIKCGNRNLSVVDFCLKELNLSFKDSVKLLDNAYNMQKDLNRARGWSIHQDIYLRDQYQEWFKAHKAERLKYLNQTHNAVKNKRQLIISTTKDKITALRENTNITPAKRKEQINILKANQVIDLKALTTAKEKQQELIRKTFNLEMQASYNKFLSEQATSGDDIALEELRRLKVKFTPAQNDTQNSFQYVDHYKEFRLNISHEIDNDGNIYYKLDNRAIIKDTGKKVELLQDTDDNIKLTLDLAMAKFGKSIELTGTSEFREKIVELAIKNNYKVEFLDEFSKQHHDKVLEQIKAAENNLDDDNDFGL